MVQDGTQGTQWGCRIGAEPEPLRELHFPQREAIIPATFRKNGNLSEAAGATACYVSDIANRLTGWVRAPSDCQD